MASSELAPSPAHHLPHPRLPPYNRLLIEAAALATSAPRASSSATNAGVAWVGGLARRDLDGASVVIYACRGGRATSLQLLLEQPELESSLLDEVSNTRPASNGLR